MATTWIQPGTDETLTMAFWDVASGTISSSSNTPHTGPACIEIGQDSFARAYTVSTSAGSRVVTWLYVSSAPSSTVTILFFHDSPVSANAFRIDLRTDGLLLLAGVATIGTSTISLTTGRWYQITTAWTITSVSSYELRVYVNGNLEISGSGGVNPNLSTAVATGVTIANYSGSSAGGTLRFDDLYADNSTALTDPGAIRSTAKLPTTATGSWTNFLTGAVNERPFNTANGKQTTTNNDQTFDIEAAASGDVDISSATIVARMAWLYADATVVSGTAAIFDGGASTSITLNNINNTYTHITDSSVYPSGATAIGMTGQSANTTHLYECGVVLAYRAPATQALGAYTLLLPRSRMREW